MKVLISIRQPVVAWVVPPAHVAILRERFPHITFTHALDERADLDGISDADIAFTWIMSPVMLARARKLRWVHSSAVAVGTLPLAALAARRVMVTNSRGVQSVAIAEHVIATMLALSRRLPMALRRQETRTWAQNELIGGASPWLIDGQRMAIVGLGTIGQSVAVRAAGLGMHVVGVRRRPDRAVPPGVREVVGPDRLDRALAACDVLVLSAPLTAATERVIGAREIAMLRRGAVVINVARGQLVDERALASGLMGGHLAGAALDVFDEEPLPPTSALWSLPNVIVTPHTSGFRADHWDAVVDLFSDQIRRFEAGQPLLNQVDLEMGY